MLSFSNMTIFARQNDTSRMHSTVCSCGLVVNCVRCQKIKKNKKVTKKKKNTHMVDALKVVALNVCN